MEITLKQKVKFDVAFIGIAAAVRYEEEDMPNDAPMRDGGMWRAMVNADTHRIIDWPEGKTLSFYMKVCDEGIYTLYDKDKNLITEKSGYVPNDLLPGEYGDYLELKIDETGLITNWLSDADFSDFTNEEE